MTKVELVEKIQGYNIPNLSVTTDMTAKELEAILDAIENPQAIVKKVSELENIRAELQELCEELNTRLASAESAKTTGGKNPVVECDGKKFEVLTGVSVNIDGEVKNLSAAEVAENQSVLKYLVEIESGAIKKLED